LLPPWHENVQQPAAAQPRYCYAAPMDQFL
jgi:hypothetical protein